MMKQCIVVKGNRSALAVFLVWARMLIRHSSLLAEYGARLYSIFNRGEAARKKEENTAGPAVRQCGDLS